MKKQILFVIPSMRSGGAEKSLLTLLTLFDYKKYDVELLSFRHDGLFFDKLPPQVKLIGGNRDYEMFDGDAVNAVKYFIKSGKPISALERWKYSKLSATEDAHLRNEGQWKYLKKQLPKIKKHYDCAIGYLEGNANRFVAECVAADKKICYIHNDIEKLGFDKVSDEAVFACADKIVTVSQECKNSLCKHFPDYADKIEIIENITSRKILTEQGKSEAVYVRAEDETVICTVGRFSEQKNIPLAVRACAELIKRGKKIKWYHIGSGNLKGETEKELEACRISESFILLGERANPYPYIAQCDIYVQPSLFEGKSIAIDEAKCLCRPIVVTNFSTVYDQLEDGVNGLICRMDETDMADKIQLLIENPNERKRLSEELMSEKLGNEEEIFKLYELIE